MAAAFGMARRAADFRNRFARGGNDDAVELPGKPMSMWSPEFALRRNLSYATILGKCQQAEANAKHGKCPVVIVKPPRAEDRNALVVFRLEVFRERFDLEARLDTPNNLG